MNKIKWCLKQNKGIELVEPNENLCDQYFIEAEKTLQLLEGRDNKWEVIMAYYACYHALYALLMKAGIKCEIHDCTLALMEKMAGFDRNDTLFLVKLKEQRIRAQYYLKEERLRDLAKVKKFIFKCRELSEELDVKMLRGIVDVSKK
ncbi:MAG: hypothetical protein ABIH82_00400 [Candidatus Woesearchaeota archaeon]|nr:hypothetical protein [Nanoarchaeota archaeon]